MILSPLIGFICVLCSKDKRTRELEQKLSAFISEQRKAPSTPTVQDNDKFMGIKFVSEKPVPKYLRPNVVVVSFLVIIVALTTASIIIKNKGEAKIYKAVTHYNESTNNDNTDQYGVIRWGIINTVVDGYDVLKVNLWSQPNSPRQQVFSVTNGQKVKIIDENNDYYKIEDNGLSGWCMKGFVNEL